MTIEIKEPKQVQRIVRSKIEIISSDQESKVMSRYERFMNFIMSYGAIIKSVTHSQSTAVLVGEPFTQHSVFINYELPINVTDKHLIGAYEFQ